MKILLLAIGKTDEKYLETGIRKYMDRIVHYVPFEMKLLPDLKNRRNLGFEQQKQAEGEWLLAELQPGDGLVLLDENGKQFTSREFSSLLDRKITN
ncbi:MAG: 23S rRNA (pseudouridine(1915)-N(3))-methyltransferase RlmH, partial [Bacteroidales bacterium]|nr:23S rRNA (pseudouridine(1915)-N(3))-methyltransferase RlmH [Bacteroidales bacterium]